MRAFERGHVKKLAIGRDSQPVATAFNGLVPDDLLRGDIESRNPAIRADVEHPGLPARRDPLDVFRLFPSRYAPGWNALYEFVSVVHVEYQDPHAAVLDIVADTGRSDIEQVFLLRRGRPSRQNEGGESDETLRPNPGVTYAHSVLLPK